MLTKFQLYIPTTQHTGTIVVPLSDQWYKDCGFDSPWRCGILIQNMKCFVVKTSYLQNLTLKTSFANCWFLVAVDLWTFVISDRRDYHLSILYNTVKSQNWTSITFILLSRLSPNHLWIGFRSVQVGLGFKLPRLGHFQTKSRKK